MKSKIKWVHCFIILLLTFSLPMYAQIGLKGEISGVVVDENGEALPGASVTLTGESLFQESLSKVSSGKGLFRFISLIPGNYELEFFLQGFNSLKITNIRASVGQATPIRAVLTPKKIEEEITVIGEAPLIETKTTQLSTNFSKVVLETIPAARRDFIDIVDATPAVNDFGGAYGGGAERGGQSISNSYRLNGVDVSNPDIGNTWVSPNYDTIEEIQVVGVGASAEYGNFMGATINIVTKSGSNKFHGGISSYYTNGNLYGDNSGGIIDLKPNEIKYDAETVAYLGGPLIKEKLLFFLSAGYTSDKTKAYGAPEYGLLKNPSFQLKLDWLATKNNNLTIMVNGDPRRQENIGLLPGSGPEIAASRIYNTTTVYAGWQSILGSNTISSIKYAGYRAKYEYEPVVPDKPYYSDGWTGKKFQAAGTMHEHKRYRDEINASLTHYADDFLGASHEFKFGLEYEKSRADNIDAATGPGGSGFWGAPFLGNTQITAVVGYELRYDTSVERFGGFVQDNVLIGTKMTLNLGLRFDAPRMYWWEWSDPLTKWVMFSPRVGLSYDVGGDAKDVIHVHVGRYYDKMTLYGWQLAVPAFPDMTYYNYTYPGYFEPTAENLANLPELIIKPENIWFTFSGSDPNDVDPDLRHGAYTDVFNIGYEKELFRNFALSVDYIYKRDRGMIQINDRSEHTYEQREWSDPWLGNTITVWEQLDRTPPDYYHTNSSWTKRRHHFLIVSLRKREVGNWSMMASYTYQNSRGNVDNDDAVALGLWPWGRDNDPYYTENSIHWGPVGWDRTHQLKIMGTCLLPWGFSVSGDLRFLSGRAWEPKVFLGTAQAFYRPGSHYVTLEPRGSRREPSVGNFNFRLAKSFNLGGLSNLQLMVDVLNVFNNDDGRWYYTEPYAVYPLSQEESFGKPRSLYAPISLRLGVRWTF